MKITAIELSKVDQDFIFNKLISEFDIELASIGKGHTINFPLNELIEVEAILISDIERSKKDENNQDSIIHQSGNLKRITFMFEGDQVKTNDWDIEDRISNYYRI